MFTIGEKIVYPMHGAGFIDAIEEREISGMKKLFYILKFPNKDIVVMIPKESKKKGFRKIVSLAELEEILDNFYKGKTDEEPRKMQNYRINFEKMKSGDIIESTTVIRDLKRQSNKKKLCAQDKSLMKFAKDILSSEIAMVMDVDQQQADEILDKVITDQTDYLSI